MLLFSFKIILNHILINYIALSIYMIFHVHNDSVKIWTIMVEDFTDVTVKDSFILIVLKKLQSMYHYCQLNLTHQKWQLIVQDNILKEHMPVYQKIFSWLTANFEYNPIENNEIWLRIKIITNIKLFP